jgi:hypothetical protein
MFLKTWTTGRVYIQKNLIIFYYNKNIRSSEVDFPNIVLPDQYSQVIWQFIELMTISMSIKVNNI